MKKDFVAGPEEFLFIDGPLVAKKVYTKCAKSQGPDLREEHDEI